MKYPSSSARTTVIVIVGYLAFAILGVAFAMFGALWDPHIRRAFGMSLDGNASLFLLNGVAYFLASFVGGRVVDRFAPGMVLVISMGMFVLGLLAQLAAPVWMIFVLGAFVLSFGGGLMDATVNIVFAARASQRLMNWLHAAFGVGTLAAPLLANFVLGLGGSWVRVYALMAVASTAMTALIALTRGHWYLPRAENPSAPKTSTRLRATLALPLVWVGIATFVLYGGLEATGGNWLQTLFMNGHGQSEPVARSWLGAFWISFTVGRIFWGFFAERIAPATLIAFSLLGAVLGGALLWMNPWPAWGWLGAAIAAFMIGPLFAVAIALTQQQLGPEHAPNAIGIQIAATNVGVSIIPGVVGAITEATASPSVIALSMLLLAVLMLGLHGARGRMARVIENKSIH